MAVAGGSVLESSVNEWRFLVLLNGSFKQDRYVEFACWNWSVCPDINVKVSSLLFSSI